MRRLVREVVGGGTVLPQVRQGEKTRTPPLEVLERGEARPIGNLAAVQDRIEVHQRKPEVGLLVREREAKPGRPRGVPNATEVGVVKVEVAVPDALLQP